MRAHLSEGARAAGDRYASRHAVERIDALYRDVAAG
jgi:hypothetical protein